MTTAPYGVWGGGLGCECCGSPNCYDPCPTPSTQMRVTLTGITSAGGCTTECLQFNTTWTANQQPGGCSWLQQLTPGGFCVFPHPTCSVQYSSATGLLDVFFGPGLGNYAHYQVTACPPKSGDSVTVPRVSLSGTDCTGGWPGSITLTGV